MRILISDASVLIDLNKVGLMDQFMLLSYDFVIPDVIVDELYSFNEMELARLAEKMTVCTFTANDILKVEQLILANQKLSEPDLFALLAAQAYPNSILLTGDRRLKNLALESEQEVHGLLWAVSQIHEETDCPTNLLVDAILFWKNDPFCWIKDELLEATLKTIGMGD